MKIYVLIFMLGGFYTNLQASQVSKANCSSQGNKKAVKTLFILLTQEWGDNQEAKQQNLKKIAILLKEHPEIVNAKNSTGAGDSALMAAVKRNKLAEVKLLLQYHPDLDAQNILKETALMQAARLNSPRLLELLLRFGANPNIQDSEGRTALMRSMYSFPESLRTIEVLLAYYADPEITDNKGQTAYTIDSHKVLEFLIENAKKARADKRLQRHNELGFYESLLYDTIQDSEDDQEYEEKKLCQIKNEGK